MHNDTTSYLKIQKCNTGNKTVYVIHPHTIVYIIWTIVRWYISQIILPSTSVIGSLQLDIPRAEYTPRLRLGVYLLQTSSDLALRYIVYSPYTPPYYCLYIIYIYIAWQVLDSAGYCQILILAPRVAKSALKTFRAVSTLRLHVQMFKYAWCLVICILLWAMYWVLLLYLCGSPG